MAKITHYEVYIDKGTGWKLEERFSSDKRNEAFTLAKELEGGNVAVKIIQEIYDVQMNSYYEVVDYVSGLYKKNRPNYKDKTPYKSQYSDYEGSRSGFMFNINKDMIFAILKLVAIIFICLVVSNLLLMMLSPIIDSVFPDERQKGIKFFVFFLLFLLITIPLVLKKVPWHVFVNQSFTPQISDKKVYRRGENLIRRYQLNEEYEQVISPSYPEAPIEYKRHIIEYLSQIISNLDRKSAIRDSFSKLGIKLLVYGGCLELSRYSGLGITQANSLLNEAFSIIDGEITDLEAFYEAKKTYSDNKIAVYLTGVGSYIMAQIIREKPLDVNLLRKTFEKWENQNHTAVYEDSPQEEDIDKVEQTACVLNMMHVVGLYDPSDKIGADQIEDIQKNIMQIVDDLAKELKGRKYVKREDMLTVAFSNIQNAVSFCIDFFDRFYAYQEDVNDENLVIVNKFVILPKKPKGEKNRLAMVDDIFEHVYDGEIITDEEIKNQNDSYNFEFLGEKVLQSTSEKVELYRITY